MKISEQIAAGRSWLATGEMSRGGDQEYSCYALAASIDGTIEGYVRHEAGAWYLRWLRENEIVYSCAIRQESGFYSFSREEQQNFRFLLMCFAELAAIDEGL